MAVINTNVKALFSQMALKNSGLAQSTAMQQLSSGKRINSARDDAAGMAIATRMTHQIRSLNQAVRNAGDAISMIQTAEGATNEITDMMQRMRELAVQAVNDTNDNAQRSYLDLEFQQLKQQIVQIADNTEWNGFSLLNGKAGEQVGEMPVYKATSVNLTGDVFLKPTTARTLQGSAGEQQVVTLTNLPTINNDATYDLVFGKTLSDPGVTVKIGAADVAGFDTLAAKIKKDLEGSSQFGPGSGRTISVDSSNNLVITYPASDQNVDPIEFDDGGSGLAASVATSLNAVTQTAESFSNDGKFIRSGELTIQKTNSDVDGDGNKDVLASFLTSDNETITMVGNFDAANGTVTFAKASGSNSRVISDDLTYTLKDSDGTAFESTAGDEYNLTSRAFKLTVAVEGSIPALRAGDLIINGIDVGGSYATDDTLSPPNNASGSAIAKAAAINRKAAASGIPRGETQTLTFSGTPQPGTIVVGGVAVTITQNETTAPMAAAKIAAALKASAQFGEGTNRVVSYAQGGSVVTVDFPVKDGDVGPIEIQSGQTSLASNVDVAVPYSNAGPGTGVYAKVNENVFAGKAMSGTSAVSGVVFINGYASANITTVMNNPRETRMNVVRAINLISDQTGVKAIDTGSDTQGVTLVAADGRNIEVSFETSADPSDFGNRIGMRQGVQASTLSLESKIPNAVVLTSTATGDIGRVGLQAGNYTKNQSVYNTVARDIVTPALPQISSLTVSGTSTSMAAGDTLSVVINGTTYSAAATGGETAQQMRDKLINAIKSNPDVTVTAGSTKGELLLTSKTPGASFTVSVAKTLASSTSDLDISSKMMQASKAADTKNLGTDDLQINGISIRAATTADDIWSSTVSTSSNRSASAIALAAAINDSTVYTGVRAEANPAVIKGGYTETRNVTRMINGEAVTSATPEGMQSLFLNGIEVKVEFKQNEDPVERRLKVVNAINERTGQHGVVAEDNGKGVNLKTMDGRNLSVWFDSNVEGLSAANFGLDEGGAIPQTTKISLSGNLAIGSTVGVTVNGVAVSADITGAGTAVQDLVDKINNTSALKNLVAQVDPNDSSAVLITSRIPGSPMDVRGANVSDEDDTIKVVTVHANDFGSTHVTGIRDATSLSDSARTLYGTVRLIGVAADLPQLPGVDGRPTSPVGMSGKPISITTGADGFGTQSNFDALGFQVGTFGGRSSADMDPPRVGRLAFQVGASANQIVTIDLADFGKKGSITGEITGDIDLAVESRQVRINSREGATAVLTMLDTAMDKVNATRATMGAVMNRLDHVINNLNNVSMNMSASRSQIEDADYAQASTELAKTQIMQQAATAVLAQANTSQQTVLKLLGG